MLPHLKELKRFVSELDLNLLFAALSGSHAYGYAHKGSDFDIRGSFAAPTADILALSKPKDTIVIMRNRIDATFHEIEKFMQLLIKQNGNSYEQLFCPLIIKTSRWHSLLQNAAMRTLTKHIYNHYKGMCWKNYVLFVKDKRQPVPRICLFIIRALMTGIYVLTKGGFLLDINSLPKKLKISASLIQRLVEHLQNEKTVSRFKKSIDAFILKLFVRLDSAYELSSLPEQPDTESLNALLLKIRKHFL